ncbi:type II 3-dehydroquinate dehydratase [Irregularibacter muris]|uniref:3-dehydroquinate dehydratase n=1 Tax=Irregularibacter muris TaxID=1796619 RepID=A0AAE3HEL0_9FIRM|nr:type II 3-dehydroquinate dehydratase [Irregularibacter muris]MCR1897984.1 type II 3-dehydroquinate dehydratase [Irregularibacter muris]
MKKIMVLHGPNLNLLGFRKPHIYGKETLQDINGEILEKSSKLKVRVEIFQFNSEGQLIEQIHKAHNMYDGIIINPAAFTHYSYAIRDAIEAIEIPTIEVHLSNIYNRECFRAKSVISPVCLGQISGLGKEGYILALEKLASL